ncbi:MAG: hypothetical protein Q4E10_02420 [Porphyromonas sp.]|nr:hypothetical protein [Porphyromonas sp.]
MPPLRLDYRDFPRHLYIQLPYSKSIAARQLLLKYIHREPLPTLPETEAALLLYSQDIIVLLRALTALRHRPSGECLSVECGESGTAMRFLIVLSLLEPAPTQLVGSQRLLHRIASDDLSFINTLGGEYRVDTSAHSITIYPPKVWAPRAIQPVWHSSQYATAIEICNTYLSNPIPYSFDTADPSYSYLLLTREVIAHPVDYIERDWSAAAFWYQLLSCSDQLRQITFPNLNPSSHQPDRQLMQIYRFFGIETYSTTQGVQARKVSQPTAEVLEIDLSQNLDLFLPIALTCVRIRKSFHISGISHLRQKESNRIDAFLHNIAGYGITGFRASSDHLYYDGTAAQTAATVTVDSCGDHRVAMAFGVYAVTEPSAVTVINHPEVVAKSYPGFFSALNL